MVYLITDKELFDLINQITGRIDDEVRGLKSGEGTAGELISDKQIYFIMNRSVT